MFWLTFYKIAYIAKLIVFLSQYPPSFPRSTRAESNAESGNFTNILHSKRKYTGTVYAQYIS